MRRTVPLVLKAGAAAVLLAGVLSPVQGNSLGYRSPATSRVTVDGRSFLREESGIDDLTRLKKAFEKFGVELPEDFDLPPNRGVRDKIFSDRLVEVPSSTSPPLPPIPHGLIPDHSLRLETGSGPVDLLFGKMARRGASIRNQLVAERWTLFATGGDTGRIRVLEKTTGKEKAIVCLDEAEGAFLLLGESRR